MIKPIAVMLGRIALMVLLILVTKSGSWRYFTPAENGMAAICMVIYITIAIFEAD